MKKKSCFTLLEIIIVIFLITLITGAIGYSMKGTLDKGKVFRTEQAIEQLRDLFLMCLAEGETSDDIIRSPEGVIRKYGLAKNPKKITEDGWGEPLNITYLKRQKDFSITSENLVKYKAKQNKSQAQPQDLGEDE
ncbi:MAG: type II secretion system protein [Chlamydiales bacterium]